MSIPISCIASTTAGFMESAGADPADLTSTSPLDKWVKNAAAICDLPALCTQTNKTEGLLIELLTFQSYG
jgi:hypothetical protein